MRTRPVRFWLSLLLIAVVAVPAVTTLALLTLRPPPSPQARISHTLDPALRASLLENAARWDDPRWQATIEPQLASAGLAALLVDSASQVVYRSPGWPVESRSREAEESRGLAAGQPATTLTVPTETGTALAVVIAGPAVVGNTPPEPPWFDSDFWRIPLAQMAALLLIVVAIALFVYRTFLRPLAQTVDAMRQVGAGDLEVRLPRSRVTEVDEIATAFGAMADELRQSLERQEALEQERRMTIGALVHDLRTPLFSLRGSLEGLATGVADSPEKRARYFRVAREKADALERLISDLFAYTRTEYLEVAPRPEPLELGELLRRTVDGMQPQAEAKGVHLGLAGTAEPVTVAGDPALLMRAVENVLDNAVRHTPAGGEIAVDWRQSAAGVTFTVSDSGPGIAVDDLPHLFTPLFRGETSRNRRTGGAGLGLTIARRLLRAHGGDLTAANGREGGAVFSGSLPPLAEKTATIVLPAASDVVTAHERGGSG
jgi:signal transduction histidine kinase